MIAPLALGRPTDRGSGYSTPPAMGATSHEPPATSYQLRPRAPGKPVWLGARSWRLVARLESLGLSRAGGHFRGPRCRRHVYGRWRGGGRGFRVRVIHGRHELEHVLAEDLGQVELDQALQACVPGRQVHHAREIEDEVLGGVALRVQGAAEIGREIRVVAPPSGEQHAQHETEAAHAWAPWPIVVAIRRAGRHPTVDPADEILTQRLHCSVVRKRPYPVQMRYRILVAAGSYDAFLDEWQRHDTKTGKRPGNPAAGQFDSD